MAMSHAGHDHPMTPAGRSACRKTQEQGSTALRERHEGIKSAARNARANLAAKEKAAARIANRPRRAGARVSIKNSTCVQAALHVDAHGGRCACGWVAAA